MIRLINIINEIEEGIEDVEFIQPEETNIDYYKDLNRMERESGIYVMRDKTLTLLAIRNGKVVGALYESNDFHDTFSFDIIVDKNERKQRIGTKLIDIGISDFKEFREYGCELKLDVVNPNLIDHLLKRGLKIVDRYSRGVIMTL